MAGRVGKFRLAFLLSLVSCGMILAAPSTREDVVRMLKSRTPESSILVAIRSSHTAYDLTADDIADLREAGASQAVIDAMIDSGASTAPVAQPSDSGDLESSQAAAETAGPETGTEPETVTEYVPVPVAPPPPAYYGYPFYPLYAPVYYPVYDPFFSGFYGPWFSFGFVSSFGFHTIFPCHSSFVVVGHGCDFHHFSGGGYVGSRSRAFSRASFAAPGGSMSLAVWK